MGTKTGHGLEECGYADCTGPGPGNRDICGKGRDTIGNAAITQEDEMQESNTERASKLVTEISELKHNLEITHLEMELQSKLKEIDDDFEKKKKKREEEEEAFWKDYDESKAKPDLELKQLDVDRLKEKRKNTLSSTQSSSKTYISEKPLNNVGDSEVNETSKAIMSPEEQRLHEAAVAEVHAQEKSRREVYAKEKSDLDQKKAYEKKRQDKHSSIIAKNNQRAQQGALKAIKSLESKANKKPEKPKSPGFGPILGAHAKDFLLALVQILPLPIATKTIKKARKKAMKSLTDYERKKKSYKRATANHSKNSKKMRYNLAKMRKAYDNGDFSAYRQKDPDYYTYVYGSKNAA